MANKREFKKYVDALGATVLDEMSCAYNLNGIDRDKVINAMGMALSAIGKARNNANISFDRGPKAFADLRAYSKARREFYTALFDKIQTEFSEEMNQALKALNECLPAEVREQNKALANA